VLLPSALESQCRPCRELAALSNSQAQTLKWSGKQAGICHCHKFEKGSQVGSSWRDRPPPGFSCIGSLWVPIDRLACYGGLPGFRATSLNGNSAARLSSPGGFFIRTTGALLFVSGRPKSDSGSWRHPKNMLQPIRVRTGVEKRVEAINPRRLVRCPGDAVHFVIKRPRPNFLPA
jgi:hypothetical protein